MDKGGQFYIMAAIIIVMAISILGSVTSYAIVKSKPVVIEGLSADLKEESIRVIDYGIHENEVLISNNEDLNIVLDSFVNEIFSPYYFVRTENSDIILVFGDANELFSYKYNLINKGEVTITPGTSKIGLPQVQEFKDVKKLDINGDKITVNLLGKDYEFDVKEGQMFYFVMVEERDGEVYIERNG